MDNIISLYKDRDYKMLPDINKGIKISYQKTNFERTLNYVQTAWYDCEDVLKRLYSFMLDKNIDKEKFQEYMKSKGIMTKTYFNPIHLKTYYRQKYGYKEGDLPIPEKLSKKMISLPFYPDIKKEEIEHITINIKQYLKQGE